MDQIRRRVATVTFLAAMACALGGAVPFTAPEGDLNSDGSVNAVDLQCMIRLWTLLVGIGPTPATQCGTDFDCLDDFEPDTYCRKGFTKNKVCLPTCLAPEVNLGDDPGVICEDPAANDDLCLGTTQKQNADMNCDGVLGNQDLNFLVAIIMGKLGFPGSADQDGDHQLNYCDDDSDGDVDPDASDCAVLNPAVHAGAKEVCNGLDEDCDGNIDEGLGTSPCGVGACLHTIENCVAGVAGVCDPFAGAMPEECNGIDDDCNGKIDDGADVDLCQEFILQNAVNSVICYQGICLASDCDQGWHDLNGDIVDGCECQDDPNEKANKGCTFSWFQGDFGDVDGGAMGVFSGNDPDGSGDWFTFQANDVPEAGTDNFHAAIRFLENPNDAYGFDVYWNNCGPEYRICADATAMDWYTDHFDGSAKASWPGIPGPWITGGGEKQCAYDPDHQFTPEKFDDDTSDTTHACTDNSMTLIINVHLLDETKATCGYYKVEISNGVY